MNVWTKFPCNPYSSYSSLDQNGGAAGLTEDYQDNILRSKPQYI